MARGNGGAAAPTAAATLDWRRCFESLRREYDYVVDEIEGTLPPDLVGTHYRNGPGINEIGGVTNKHLFDGDGMVVQFIFDGRQVRFRNRFVRTPHFEATRRLEPDGSVTDKVDRPVMRGYGNMAPNLLGNLFRSSANVAHTSVSFQAGNLLANYEGGKPYALDPDTMDTIGEHDYDGGLRRFWCYSAHCKIDPKTGELFNFGMDYVPTRLRAYRVDARGRMHHLRSIALHYPAQLHDFALSEKYLIFLCHPMYFHVFRFAFGRSSVWGALEWRPQLGTTIIRVPRDGGKPLFTQFEPFFYFHVSNAFDDRGDTVVDLVRYEDMGYHGAMQNFRGDLFDDASRLVRLRLDARGGATQETLMDVPCEYPVLDYRLATKPYRYAYMPAFPGGEGIGSQLAKVDTTTGERRVHEFGTDYVVAEPTFVPRNPDSGEDDGYLLTPVYSPAEHRSRLVILDARDVEAEPVAVVKLRHHLPEDFHGIWTRRVAQVD